MKSLSKKHSGLSGEVDVNSLLLHICKIVIPSCGSFVCLFNYTLFDFCIQDSCLELWGPFLERPGNL